MNNNLALFKRFFRIGLLTFGGGYSMLPMMERELADKEKWVSREELLDYYAVSQCTPGIIAVNTATFIGNKINGFWGSLFATVGIVLPSLLIITVIAAVLEQFMHLPAVRYAFFGVRAAVAGMMISAVVRIAKSAVKGVLGVIIAASVFVCSVLFNVTPIAYVAAAAVIGLIAWLIGKRGEKGGKKHA